jgi:hypothetical protein
MAVLIRALIVAAVAGFGLAVIAALTNNDLAGVSAEGFSRACTNLTLIAIAVMMAQKTLGTTKA